MPTSLRAAFEMDKAYALKHKRLNVERLAELLSITPSLLYKWLEQENMPARTLIGWQHLTGSNHVARYIAATSHAVVIDIPTGRKTSSDDVHALQATLHGAVGALLAFMAGDMDRDACLANLGSGLESLAWHRENVRKADQPELELF